MFPRPVEPHRLCKFDVLSERLRRGRREPALLPIPLVEHQPLIVRTVVQTDLAVLVNGNFAHADARMGKIDLFPALI